jgi:peptidoglycan/LPS O-acetylase OafA/YrhL
MSKLLDLDLRQHAHWLKWASWSSLVMVMVCDRSWHRLPWETWQTRMLYLALVPGTVILCLTRVTVERRGFLALAALVFFCLQICWAGDTQNVDELRKSNVMVWVFTIALAVYHDASKLPGGSGQGTAEKGNSPNLITPE